MIEKSPVDGFRWLKLQLKRFFLPEVNRKSLLRLLITGLTAAVIFSIFKPCFISGSSMEPNFGDKRMVFSFRLRYLWSSPRRGDVVTIAFFGKRELLKRVVALPGDTVEFKDGQLLVNRTAVNEPYVKFDCNWNLPEKTIRKGHFFVVGDNRSQSHLEHRFGEVASERITGGVWF